MRLKSLTNLNTLLLVTVCVALAATLWWSQRALERPYLLMERYLSLSQQFQREAARNILDYLGSGDALQHSAAIQALDNLAPPRAGCCRPSARWAARWNNWRTMPTALPPIRRTPTASPCSSRPST